MTDHDPTGDPTRVDVPVTDATQAMPAVVGGPPPPPAPPPGPPTESGGNAGWILAGLLALVLLVGLAVLLLNDDDDASTSNTTTTSLLEDTTTTSTTEATTTTVAPTTTAPPSTIAPSACTSGAPDDPDASVEVLYQAFGARDRACADELATEEAVDALFSIPGTGSDWQFQGCEEQDLPDPHVDCAYTFTGGATHFLTAFSAIDGWVIYEVFQTAD